MRTIVHFGLKAVLLFIAIALVNPASAAASDNYIPSAPLDNC